ncbi:MAG: twin-arginine translocase subunit TatC [Gammaproteobacteria bacterium]|nr:twin-arginine translocase subunit TatC [Gammaproteobacteria bacterium]
MSNTEHERDRDREQPLIEHLIELRTRLLRGLYCVAVVFLALFPFAGEIYGLVAGPLMSQLPAGATMIATEVASPFLVPFKLCIYLALFLSMPYVLYQAWAFIAPGLYASERRFAVPLLVSSIALFYAGAAFAFFIVFPLVFGFFASVVPPEVALMTDINHYLDFVLTMFLAFGLAFEVPIATLLLIWTGLVTAESLARSRPYIIVGAFIVGALLSPPDVLSQTLLSVPIWLLFEAGLYFSRFLPRAAREADEGAHEQPR